MTAMLMKTAMLDDEQDDSSAVATEDVEDGGDTPAESAAPAFDKTCSANSKTPGVVPTRRPGRSSWPGSWLTPGS